MSVLQSLLNSVHGLLYTQHLLYKFYQWFPAPPPITEVHAVCFPPCSSCCCPKCILGLDSFPMWQTWKPKISFSCCLLAMGWLWMMSLGPDGLTMKQKEIMASFRPVHQITLVSTSRSQVSFGAHFFLFPSTQNGFFNSKPSCILLEMKIRCRHHY